MHPRQQAWAPLFFAVSACSWVPHWTCHYFRLETRSAFVVGNWRFTRSDSLLALVVYGVLVLLGLVAVAVPRMRVLAASVSGVFHLFFAALHYYRLVRPFTFVVFGYSWSAGSSLREAVLLSLFGGLSVAVAAVLGRNHRGAEVFSASLW